MDVSEAGAAKNTTYLKIAAVAASVLFLYATVLVKLAQDWYSDENYSHGLLVPFIILFIVWRLLPDLRAAARAEVVPGALVTAAALCLLFAGVVGAELFAQRISFVLLLAGVVLYFFGRTVLRYLLVPFALLLLAIPLPQIIFNRIAFPLQLLASQAAVRVIRFFEVPTLRKGNVIEILPVGSVEMISLEVVEACSGIRSMMTLITLALVLAYFTRLDERLPFLSRRDTLRTIVLMLLAVPIAVATNAARVAALGVMTWRYGSRATDPIFHDGSGWVVFIAALALLIGFNFLLRRLFRGGAEYREPATVPFSTRAASVVPLVIVLAAGALLINWFATRAEVPPDRTPLAELPQELGEWRQKGSEYRFGEQIEGVLKVSDYTMREYYLPDGRIANIYIGYYASQRTGTTYHSPQNCLPGAGWVMLDPQAIEIPNANGTKFTANRFRIENGPYNEVMIYWYQGRGRREASEYTDKLNTIWDSVTRRRTDGALVRVMTSVGTDERTAIDAAQKLAATLAAELPQYVPD